jgi:uncharacterized membrane protein YcaP (DUF421 family)
MNIPAPDNGYPVILVNDGRIMSGNLKIMGRDENWLKKELRKRGTGCAKDVYLLMLDSAGNIYYAAKEPET